MHLKLAQEIESMQPSDYLQVQQQGSGWIRATVEARM
jgi:hypothetical protein